MVRFQRTNKATNEKNWLVINWIEDNPDCNWTDDYDSSDIFENEDVFNSICYDLCIEMDFNTYNYELVND